MSEHDDHREDDAGDLLAAEYALGVLDGEARRAARARLDADPAFAAEVDAWSARLASLGDDVPAVSPPPSVWTRIVERLSPAPAAPKASNDNAALRFWRGLALGASGLAAASVAAVVILLARPPTPATEVATLTTEQGAALVVAAFDPRTGALHVSPAAGLQPAGRTPHLWLMHRDGRVVLIGPIDPGRAATHSLPRPLARRAEQATGLALSLEPAGHAPIDKPGGPVVASGEFTRL